MTPYIGASVEVPAQNTDDLFKIALEAKFLNSMKKAEETHAILGTATQAEKDAMAHSLDAAWNELKALRELPSARADQLFSQAPQMARIALLRGDCRWAEENMETTRQLFSLALQLARGEKELIQKIPGLETDSLEDLLKRLTGDRSAFAALEEELANSSSTDALIRETLDNNESRGLAIAQAARNLGGTYQNHDLYKPSDEDSPAARERKILLCENAIRIAETIWEKANTTEAQWLLLTCKYNTGPYRHELRQPKDRAGMLKIYEEVLDRVKTLQKDGETAVKVYQQEAQCYNMMMRFQPETASPAEKFGLLEKAAALAAEYAQKGFNTFLVRMFLQNKASFAFKCLDSKPPLEGITLEMIDRWHDQVQKMCAEEGYKHIYDAIFCLNAAKAAHLLGKTEKASELLKQGLLVCDKHPSSSQDIRSDIEAFKANIG
jgi:hypothetical protein